MQEEKEQELQETVGEENSSESTEVTPEDSEKSTELIPEKVKSESKSVDGQSDKSKGVDGDGIKEEIDATHSKDTKEAELPSVESEGNKEDVLEEIDDSNAEDAEDKDNHHRHHIPILDYHSMPMENLVGELQRLVKNEKIQAIKKHVDGIKYEFDLKFQDFLEHKKEEFISHGGNELDFRYNSVAKRQFNEVYSEYREKRNQYYKNLENNLKENLANRLAIIEELKSLVNVEEDINNTYKHFKDVQESWRNAGPVPRNHYNDVWRTITISKYSMTSCTLTGSYATLILNTTLKKKKNWLSVPKPWKKNQTLTRRFANYRPYIKSGKRILVPLTRNIGNKYGNVLAMPLKYCTKEDRIISRIWTRFMSRILKKRMSSLNL